MDDGKGEADMRLISLDLACWISDSTAAASSLTSASTSSRAVDSSATRAASVRAASSNSNWACLSDARAKCVLALKTLAGAQCEDSARIARAAPAGSPAS